MAVNELLKFKMMADMSDLKAEMQKANGMMGKFTTVLKGAAGVLAATFAAGKIKDFAAESIKLYDVQAKAEAQLLTALKGRTDIQERLMQSASEMQGMSLFGDEVLIQQQAFLASMQLNEEQINKTLQAAMDLSAGTGMTLDSAVKNLSKTYGGLTGELGESIPALKNLTKEQLMQGEAIKFVTETFKDQAKVAAETGLGPIEQLKNSWGDIQETIGKLLMPAVKAFADLMRQVLPYVQEAVSNIGPRVREVANYFIDLYNESMAFRFVVESIKVAFKNVWEIAKLLFNNLVTSFKTIGNLIDSVFRGDLDGISSAVENFYAGIADNIGDFATNVGENYKEGIDKALRGKILPLPDEQEKQASSTAFFEAGKAAGAAFTKGQTAAMPNAQSMGIGSSALLAGTMAMTTQMQTATMQAMSLEEQLQRIGKVGVEIGGVLQGAAVDGFMALGNALGDALTGTGDFGSAILGVIGNFMTQLGQLMITTGIATETFKKLIIANPVAAIAAGVGLVAVGKIFANKASKMSSSMGSAGGSGGASSPRSDERTSIMGLNAQKDDKAVKVEIEGFVEGDKIRFVSKNAEYKRSRLG